MKNRQQTLQVSPHITKNEVTSCGAPQDSVLSPLLFFYISNDISYSSNQLNFLLFADDTNLLYADKNFRSLELTVNRELAIVCNWLMANKQHKEIKFYLFPAIPEMNELRQKNSLTLIIPLFF